MISDTVSNLEDSGESMFCGDRAYAMVFNTFISLPDQYTNVYDIKDFKSEATFSLTMNVGLKDYPTVPTIAVPIKLEYIQIIDSCSNSQFVSAWADGGFEVDVIIGEYNVIIFDHAFTVYERDNS